MEVSAYLVDWPMALKRQEDGELGDTIFEALDNEEPWVESLEEFPPSHRHYVAVANAWEAIRGSVGVHADVDEKIAAFMGQLITSSGYRLDLGDEGELFFVSVSPESAAQLLELIGGADFEGYREAFYSRCDASTLNTLTEYCEHKVRDRCFKEGFFSYIDSLANALIKAVEKNRGLLIHAG